MEFVGPNFKEDFPFFPSISLENNPNKDSLNMMGNSNALMQSYNSIGVQPNHDHFYGHDDGRRADDDHCHHYGIFPTDLNYDPVPMVDYHHHQPHHGDQNNGGEPMVPFDQVLPYHNLHMLAEEEVGLGASLIAGINDKGKEKVVEAQPAEETNHANTKKSMVKRQWSLEEDMRLVELVKHYGAQNWLHIAQKLGGRVGKQCRERWHSNLRSNIKKGEWSLEEDMILIEAHKQFGSKWCEIAKHLSGRTDNTVKNHWHATLRKRLPRGGSVGGGSTLLWNYFKSVTSPYVLAKNDTTNKRKHTKSSYDGKQMDVDHNNRSEIRNLNLELPPKNENSDQLNGSCGSRMPCLLFGHHLTNNVGTSKVNIGVVRK